MKWRQMEGEFHRRKAARRSDIQLFLFRRRGAAQMIRSSQVNVVTKILIYFMIISVVLSVVVTFYAGWYSLYVVKLLPCVF